jgi:hypothetical protein
MIAHLIGTLASTKQPSVTFPVDVPIDNMRDVGTLDELLVLWRAAGINKTQRVRGAA